MVAVHRMLFWPVLLAAVIALAGCGKSVEQTFQEQKLHPLQVRLEQAKGALSAQLQTARQGNPASVRAVDARIATVATLVAKLGALEPPGDLRALVGRYAAANRHLVQALRAFARALGGRGQAPLSAAGARAQLAASEIIRAQSALDAEINKHR